jgi:Zn-dependent protease
MPGEFRIATVAGIPVYLHPSWFAVAALMTWSLAVGYVPAEAPSSTPATAWVLGAILTLFVFASILAHELGHAWVARRTGLTIQRITLFVFGGVARAAGEPASPGAELAVAVAGPATSLAVALGCEGLRWLVSGLTTLELAARWLARANLLLALFNLLPGVPLDGGRALRALAWRWTGSRERATRAAAFGGQLLAAGLIGLGLLVLLRGALLPGLWLVLIGWFLQGAAARTAAETDTRQWLRGVTVAQAMTRDYARVPGDRTLERLVQEEVVGAGHRCFCVTDDGRLQGLLTLREVRAVDPARWSQTRAAEVMTPRERLLVARPDEEVLAALARMDAAGITQLPVVADDRLLGLIDREHIAHYLRVRLELGA